MTLQPGTHLRYSLSRSIPRGAQIGCMLFLAALLGSIGAVVFMQHEPSILFDAVGGIFSFIAAIVLLYSIRLMLGLRTPQIIVECDSEQFVRRARVQLYLQQPGPASFESLRVELIGEESWTGNQRHFRHTRQLGTFKLYERPIRSDSAPAFRKHFHRRCAGCSEGLGVNAHSELAAGDLGEGSRWRRCAALVPGDGGLMSIETASARPRAFQWPGFGSCARSSRRRALAALVVALVVAGIADEALACQCGRERTVQEARAAATYVVTGIVRGVRPSFVRGSRFRYTDDFVPPVWPTTAIDIQVTRSFGHAAPDRIELTHIGCCACEARFEEGREYLLFVLPSSSIRNAYEVSYCFPNRPIEAATAMFKQLPPPRIHHGPAAAPILTRLRWAAAEPIGFAGSAYLNSRVFWRYGRRIANILHSPLLLFSLWLLGGGTIGIAIVWIRRRVRRSKRP